MAEKESVPYEEMSVDELQNEKKEIDNLLASLEDQYREGSISEESYKEVKEKNKKKQEDLTKLLIDWGLLSPSEAEPKDDKKNEKSDKKDEKRDDKKSDEKSENDEKKSEEKKDNEESKSESPPKEAPPQESPQPKSQPSQKSPTQASAPITVDVSSEITRQLDLQTTKMNMEFEKLKALMDAERDSNKSMNERLQTMSEGIGELRSMVFQREGKIKDDELKLEKIDEQVSELKPETISKEFAKRDTTLSKNEMRLEKLEMKASDLVRNIGDIKSLLKSIGGLENIVSVNKDITDKMTKVNQVSKNMDRLSNKIEKMYVDLSKKMEEFILYKAKQDTMDELVKEMMKTVDIMNIKQEDFISKADIKTLKDTINSMGSRVTGMKKSIDMILPIVKTKIPDPIRSLDRRKESLEMLLTTLEEGFRKNTISRKDYDRAVKSNQRELKKVEVELKEAWEKFQKQKEGSEKEKPKTDNKTEESGASEKTKEGGAKNETKCSETKPENTEEKKPENSEKTEESEAKPSETDKAESSEPEKPESKDDEKTETGGKEEPKAESKESDVKTTPVEPPKEVMEEKPVEEKPKEDVESKPSGEKSGENVDQLLAELDDTFKKGFIGKDAYEKTKKTLMSRK